jgi:signal transduction histidine kinase
LGETPLSRHLAERLHGAREHIAARWLERIADRVNLAPEQIFPTEDLLDHVPLLIEGLAAYLSDSAEEIAADAPVIAKAMELGALRHEQGLEAGEILKEFEILGGIVFEYLEAVVAALPDASQPGRELLACARRVHRALNVIQQITTTHYLRMAEDRVQEREQRLRAFNRMLSHEIRTQVGAIRGAIDLLEEPGIATAEPERRRFQRIIAENVRAMQELVENLTELTQLHADARGHRHTRLGDVVAEATRQLREYAASRSVEVRVVEPVPELEVPAAALELALTNYVANAIKYHDPESAVRWVEVCARVEDSAELVIEVRDNGRGVAPAARERLFQRFYRAEPEAADGTGLGLSIVREVVESLGGRTWAEFPEKGSVFGLAMPARRRADAVAVVGCEPVTGG